LAAVAWLVQGKPSPAATTCVANASNISFGALGVGSLTGATSTGSLYEGCSGGWTTRGNLTTCNAIGAGSNSASQTARTMTNGSYAISYNLYSDSAMTTPYAYPGADTFYIPYSTTSGGYATTTTYAKILSAPAGLAPGVYTDSYSLNTQAWANFDTWNTTYPQITCGYNGLYAGAIPTFTVSVTVLASCAITAGALNFGTQTVLTANIDATAALSVTCTNTTPYTVALGPGNGTGATTTNRSMTGAGGSVHYGLYQDSARSVNWGANPPPAANADTVSGVGTGSAQTLTVYGRVPPQTTPKQGGYSDTVVVTLTY
jgi:spore coat protein U-like protein